jgi:hypothetical protein
MRQRLEVIAAILAAGGAAFAVQQAFSVPGTWLAAGIYVAVAGGVLLLVASRQLGSSRATWPARIVTIIALVIAVSFGALAVHLCGPTVLAFDCRA